MRRKTAIFFCIGIFLILSSPAWAIFTNGGFENGDFSSWTTGYGLNYTGLTGTAPFNESNIVITPGGSQLLSIIGPGTYQDSRTNNLLQLPREGTRTAKVNDETGSYHMNWIEQSDTITEADRDTSDGKLHVRFRYAAVLQDPGHPDAEQPYFHVTLKDTTDAITLFDDFTFSDQVGRPWQTGLSGWLWLDWQSVDIVVPDTSLGHTLYIRALAADCAQGGHGGYVYLDGFGSAPPPPPTTSTAVPTMTEWGMMIFMVLAGLFAAYRLRKQRTERA